MNLRGLAIANTKYLILPLFLLMTGCQSTQSVHHPIPVYFDGTPASTPSPVATPTAPTHPHTKNNPKKDQSKLPRLFYLLENWF